MSHGEDSNGLKAIALSKLKCQLEEVQQHNTDLTAENLRLKNKNCALQQVRNDFMKQLHKLPSTSHVNSTCILPVHCTFKPCNVAPVAVAAQTCDESLAKQSALQLAHRQQVAQLEDAVHVLKHQVWEAAVVVVLLLLPCRS